MAKRVYLFDGVNNAYNGFWDCQESPLEPGIFIKPLASTEIEPPTFNGLENTCTWDGAKWVLIPIIKPVIIDPVIPAQPTISELQLQLAYLSAQLQSLQGV